MASATDVQVQNWVDTRMRPHSELARALAHILDDDISSIDDVFAALTAPTPTWRDTRSDGPPHLLSTSDVLAFNTFIHDIRDAIKNNAQYPIVLKACVRSVTI